MTFSCSNRPSSHCSLSLLVSYIGPGSVSLFLSFFFSISIFLSFSIVLFLSLLVYLISLFCSSTSDFLQLFLFLSFPLVLFFFSPFTSVLGLFYFYMYIVQYSPLLLSFSLPLMFHFLLSFSLLFPDLFICLLYCILASSLSFFTLYIVLFSLLPESLSSFCLQF